MQAFISYRPSFGLGDRESQDISAALVSPDILWPFREFENAILDLQLARAKANAVTLVIALTGNQSKGIVSKGIFDRSSWKVLPEGILDLGSRLASRRGQLLRPDDRIYRNFMTIGFDNALRATLAIQRLVIVLITERSLFSNSGIRGSSIQLPNDNTDRLVLQQVPNTGGTSTQSMVSSAVAGIAVVPGGAWPDSAPLRIWDPARLFQATPGWKWRLPGMDADIAPPVDGVHSDRILRESVDELSASIALDYCDGLSESDFLALQEGIVDRGKNRSSRFRRLLRMIRPHYHIVKTSQTLRRKTKKRVLGRQKKGVPIVRPRRTILDFYQSAIGPPDRFEREYSVFMRHVMASRLDDKDTDSGWVQDLETVLSACFEREDDIPQRHDGGTIAPGFTEQGLLALTGGPADCDVDEGGVGGIYLSYRCEFDGDGAKIIVRECIFIEVVENKLVFAMSLINERSDGPARICEGNIVSVGDALLLVEKHPPKGRPRRIVSLLLDQAEMEENLVGCRLAAAAEGRAPALGRVNVVGTLLVRVRWRPADTHEFMQKVTQAGSFDEIIRQDFGDNEDDLSYVRKLLLMEDVRVHAKFRIAASFPRSRVVKPDTDLDLYPLECGLDDILQRAMADDAIVAPYKPGWSMRAATSGGG